MRPSSHDIRDVQVQIMQSHKARKQNYKGILYESKKGKGLPLYESATDISYKGILKREPDSLLMPSSRPASQRCVTTLR